MISKSWHRKSKVIPGVFAIAFLTLGVSSTYSAYTDSGSTSITATAGRFGSSVEGILHIPLESNDTNTFNWLTAIPNGTNYETALEPGMAPAETSFVVKNSGTTPSKLRFYDGQVTNFATLPNNAAEVVHIQILVNNTSVYYGPMKNFQSEIKTLNPNSTNSVKFIWTWPIAGKTAQDMLPYNKSSAGTGIVIEVSS